MEGRQAVRELLVAGRRKTYEILLANDLDHSDIIEDIVELAGHLRVPVTEVSRRRLDATSRTDSAQGIVARASDLPTVSLDDLLRPDPIPFLVAVDGVTDPGNLGAVLRAAECAGVNGVVLPRHRAVHITPTVTKAAAGAVEHLPMTVVGGLPTAIRQMTDAGVFVIGLDGDATSDFYELDFRHDVPVCLVLGSEGRGLSRLVAERCSVTSYLPMGGNIASLNVAAAAAVACFEVSRRRRG